MLWKLQRITLVPIQIIGYFLTLFIGTFIILTITQLFLDVKPLLYQQSSVFKGNSAVVSKNISVFKTINKEKIYFTSYELEELEEQTFIKSISKFNTATFKIVAYSEKSENVPVFYTDLFFESIPDKYIDVETEEWAWSSSQD